MTAPSHWYDHEARRGAAAAAAEAAASTTTPSPARLIQQPNAQQTAQAQPHEKQKPQPHPRQMPHSRHVCPQAQRGAMHQSRRQPVTQPQPQHDQRRHVRLDRAGGMSAMRDSARWGMVGRHQDALAAAARVTEQHKKSVSLMVAQCCRSIPKQKEMTRTVAAASSAAFILIHSRHTRRAVHLSASSSSRDNG